MSHPKKRWHHGDIVEQAYNLTALEGQLKIETMLDNRIKNHTPHCRLDTVAGDGRGSEES